MLIKGTIKYVTVYTNFNEWDFVFFPLLQWEKMNCSKNGWWQILLSKKGLLRIAKNVFDKTFP